MPFEIERKFLVINESYRTEAFRSDRIVQGYLCKQKGNSVRIRIKDKKGFITIKGPSFNGGLSRYEWEKEISLSEAEELMSLCTDSKIDKRRYLVKCGKHTYEIDEFYGDNQGLVIAEIELNDENEIFEKPTFLGKEVTGEKKYYNSHLTYFPYKYWKEK